MTWDTFHRRGDVIRSVSAVADARLDGRLPMDVEGVAETFGDDELALLSALQLKWHTRLAGRIDRELSAQPMDLERAVVSAWQATASELPGILAILDHYRADPRDEAMTAAMAKSGAKERIMLAMMAGRASAQDAAAVRVGEQIEARARATHRFLPEPGSRSHRANDTLLQRLKAVIAA